MELSSVSVLPSSLISEKIVRPDPNQVSLTKWPASPLNTLNENNVLSCHNHFYQMTKLLLFTDPLTSFHSS